MNVERRKGQRWKSVRTMARGDTLIVTGTLTQRLDSEDGWVLSNVERSDGIGAFDSCFVDSLWSNPSETMTLLADAPPEPAKCEPMCRPGTCAGCDEEFARDAAPAPPVQEAPTWWKANARCGFRIVSSNREAAVTAVGKHRATCAKCVPPAQEAPKAAPVCSRCGNGGYVSNVAFEQGLVKMCIGCRDNLAIWVKAQAGTPYAGPERLPRPRLAADWVEDCLATVWR